MLRGLGIRCRPTGKARPGWPCQALTPQSREPTDETVTQAVSQFAFVSRALDFEPAACAHAFALLSAQQSRGRASRAASDARLRTAPQLSRVGRAHPDSISFLFSGSRHPQRAERPLRPGLPRRTAHGYQERPPNHERYSGGAPISAWESSSDLRKASARR